MRLKLSVAVFVALLTSATGAAARSKPEEPTAPVMKIKSFGCTSHCPGDATAAVGSGIEIGGKNLGSVETVKFAGTTGGRVATEPDEVSEDYVNVTVPEGAGTGTVKVIDSEGNKATSVDELDLSGDAGSTGSGDTPTTEDPTTPTDPGTGNGEIALDRDKGFFKSRRQVSAELSGGDESINVVAAADDSVVATITPEAGATSVTWNGVGSDGEVVPNGDYRFQVASGGASASFGQYDHIFPLRGKHSYGMGFSGGHQGQDILSDCGQKVVSARAGKVVTSDSAGDAGNYVIVDGKKTEESYVYMHLQEPSKLQEGDRVKTGDTIGRVGDTGNATTCHLHFELWNGPAQQGGEVQDPTPSLKEWDKFS